MNEAFKSMLIRYEAARVHCLRMANHHSDSRELCHQSLARSPRSTSTEVFLAGLLDDMALAIKQTIKEHEDAPGQLKLKPQRWYATPQGNHD